MTVEALIRNIFQHSERSAAEKLLSDILPYIDQEEYENLLKLADELKISTIQVEM